MTALVDCLRTIVAGNRAGELPTMIAAGDLVELALASPSLSLPVVAQFVAALASGEPIVRNEAVFVPGNHDHHLWEMSREEAAQSFLRSGAPLEDAPQAGTPRRCSSRGRPLTRPPSRGRAALSGHERARCALSTPIWPSTRPTASASCWSPTVTTWSAWARCSRRWRAVRPLGATARRRRPDRERELGLGRLLLGGHGALDSRRHADRAALRLAAGPAGLQAMLGGLAASVTQRRAPCFARSRAGGSAAGSDASRPGGCTSASATRPARSWARALARASRTTSPPAPHLRQAVDGPLRRATSAIVIGHTHKPFSEWWDDPAGRPAACASSTAAAGSSTTSCRSRSWAAPSCW